MISTVVSPFFYVKTNEIVFLIQALVDIMVMIVGFLVYKRKTWALFLSLNIILCNFLLVINSFLLISIQGIALPINLIVSFILITCTTTITWLIITTEVQIVNQSNDENMKCVRFFSATLYHNDKILLSKTFIIILLIFKFVDIVRFNPSFFIHSFNMSLFAIIIRGLLFYQLLACSLVLIWKIIKGKRYSIALIGSSYFLSYFITSFIYNVSPDLLNGINPTNYIYSNIFYYFSSKFYESIREVFTIPILIQSISFGWIIYLIFNFSKLPTTMKILINIATIIVTFSANYLLMSATEKSYRDDFIIDNIYKWIITALLLMYLLHKQNKSVNLDANNKTID